MRVSDWLGRVLALTGVECRARCSAGREVEPAATGTSAGIVQGLGRLWLRLASGSPAIGASGEDGFRHIARPTIPEGGLHTVAGGVRTLAMATLTVQQRAGADARARQLRSIGQDNLTSPRNSAHSELGVPPKGS